MSGGLTWEEISKLPDRAPIYYNGGAWVLRWEIPGYELEVTACICGFDPATMDDRLVLARYTRERFERKRPTILERHDG